MTNEQLDEIETLAGAGGFVPRTAAENAYARALRDHALPLVKAVREARALLAAIKEEQRPTDEIRAQLLAEIEAHAEARAEIERLRNVVTQAHWLVSKVRIRSTALMEDIETLREIHKLTKDEP